MDTHTALLRKALSDFSPWNTYFHHFNQRSSYLLGDSWAIHLAIAVAGILLYSILYWLFGVCRPVILLPKNHTKSFRNFKALRWQLIVDKCGILHQRYYSTFWGFWCQSAIFTIKLLHLNKKAEQKVLSMCSQEEFVFADGEKVLLDWFIPSKCTEKTPVIAFLPGVTGETSDFCDFILSVSERSNFILVFLNRRGHSQPLTKPHFATCGDVDDCIEMFNHIRHCRPEARLYSIGISAGSGLLTTYLGTMADNCPVSAALCICSGFDTDYCIKDIPYFSQMLLLHLLKKFFVKPNAEVLKSFDRDLFELFNNTDCLQKFHGNIHRLNQHRGDITRESYLHKSNPMSFNSSVVTPTLYINAMDDLIFPERVYRKGKDRVLGNHHHLIVQMQTGGHVCFFENFWNPTRWTNRVALEYFQAFEDCFAEQSVSRMSA